MKILALGDSPYLKTGFGIVNSVAVGTLRGAGYEVAILGGQDETNRPNDPLFHPVKNDIMDMVGWGKVDDVIDEEKPDAIHIVGDPATATAWMLRPSIRALPIVAYVPIEGAPLNWRWTHTFKSLPDLKLITCSEYGVEQLAKEGITASMAYHGVSSEFTQDDPGLREARRAAVGWDDKFIVMCVAQNVRRKQWPRLFEAIRMLAKRHPDIYLYAHTVPFNNFYLGGHDLPQLAAQMGISDRVFFPPQHKKHNDASPLRGTEAPGLIDLYNMADCFVLPSQVEGFGLPLAEAMACGLPVATSDFAAAAEVVGDAGIRIPVNDWEWNQSHSIHANLAPRDIAAAIERMKRSPELRAKMSKKSLERAKAFSWHEYERQLIEVFDGIAHSIQEQAARPTEVEA